MATIATKTRTPRKVKTAAEMAEFIKAKEIELAKARQEQAYLVVADKIKNSSLVAEFKKLQADLDGAVSDIGLLAAVGKELGIKRISVTQTEPAKRAPKGTGTKATVKKSMTASKK
jgi:hypothetical protein